MKEIQFVPEYRVDLKPQPNENVYKILGKFSEKINKHEDELGQQDFLNKETLNDVYKALETAEHDLLGFFNDLERKGVISKNQNLFSSCLFLTAESIGPNMDDLADILKGKETDIEMIRQEFTKLDLPLDVRVGAEKIFFKIADYFYEMRINSHL